MIITGSVIAHKLIDNGEEIADNVSCQLPSIEVQTTEVKGAGIMGTIDMPSTGQIGSMTFTITQRSIGRNAMKLATPGIHTIELRFVQDVTMPDGQVIKEGTKVFLTCFNKKLDPGKVEPQATREGSAEFEVLRYRQVVDGTEVLLVDKRNYIYKINGVDYMEKVRAALV